VCVAALFLNGVFIAMDGVEKTLGWTRRRFHKIKKAIETIELCHILIGERKNEDKSIS
jgi:hypothetical protein